jgi:hypothetical protein
VHREYHLRETGALDAEMKRHMGRSGTVPDPPRTAIGHCLDRFGRHRAFYATARQISCPLS